MSAYRDAGALEPARTQAPAIPDLTDRLRYAEKLAQAELLPKAYRGKPANVLVAIETGHMMGIAPIAALHGIYIIDGQPAYKAGFIAAQVRRAGHQMRTWWDAERRVAITTIHRSDDPEFEYRSEWSLERAQRARLVQIKEGAPIKRDRHGNPLPWELYPENLLKARTISECARDACEELFYGAVYVPEELGAQVDADGTPAVIDQQPQNDPAERIDWDADLKSLEGDLEGLRRLGELAAQYGAERLPEGFHGRYRAAWARALENQNQHQAGSAEPVEAEVVDEDEDRCAGSGARFDAAGWTAITKDDGTEIVLCQECDSWQWSRAGAVVEHVPGGDL